MYLVLTLCLCLPGQGSQAPAGDVELKTHLDRMNREVEDNSKPLPRRVTVLLDMTAALDRAGQSAANPDAAVAYWSDAIKRIDEFVIANDDREKEPLLPLRLQAAVYLWETGRSWADRGVDSPATRRAEHDAQAARSYEAAIDRFHKVIADAKDLPLILDNCRFRLAQALSDQSQLSSTTPEQRRALIDEAAEKLVARFEVPELAGYAGLLRADLLRRNGRLDEAAKAIEAVEAGQPMPPEGERLNVLIAILNARNQFENAIRRIQASMLPDLDKAILLVRVRLAQHARLGPGAERSRVEAKTLEAAASLRGKDDRLARQTLVDVATAIDIPAIDADPAVFELLADGHLSAGRPVRAAELLTRAAERAKQIGQDAKAAEDRLKAGAILYRESKFAEALEPLKEVLEDSKAGPGRPKASLLLVLASERGSSLEPPTVARADFVKAMRRHLDTFSKDASSSEVRWLLGRELRRTGRIEEADKLWNAIDRSSPRWLDARLVVAQSKEDELLRAVLSADLGTLPATAADLRRYLETARSEAPGANQSAEFALRLARLELLPSVGKPERAREELELLLKQPVTTHQLDLARLYLIVALAGSGRVLDAESRARTESRQAGTAEVLEATRLLDRAAVATDSDLSRIRSAAIIKLLLAPHFARLDKLPEPQREELKLRQARAHALAGEAAAARSVLAKLAISTATADDVMLRDLADLYLRVDAYALVIDVERLRTRRLQPGTGAWFEARYGLALAYFRARKLDDAREIIDATAILHPTLGGGELKGKFEKLRLRLSQ